MHRRTIETKKTTAHLNSSLEKLDGLSLIKSVRAIRLRIHPEVSANPQIIRRNFFVMIAAGQAYRFQCSNTGLFKARLWTFTFRSDQL